jgi:hypothetical protein
MNFKIFPFLREIAGENGFNGARDPLSELIQEIPRKQA